MGLWLGELARIKLDQAGSGFEDAFKEPDLVATRAESPMASVSREAPKDSSADAS